jgi:hypothetical protein
LFSHKRLTGKSSEDVQVSRGALTEDEGSWGVVGGRVGDGVGLARNNTACRVLVNGGDSGDKGDKGRARKDGLEEAHVDGSVFVGVVLGIKVVVGMYV